MISCDKDTIPKTTYGEEYAMNEGKLEEGRLQNLGRVVRRNRRIWDIYSAPVAELQELNKDYSELNIKQQPMQKEANTVLFRTHYERDYDQSKQPKSRHRHIQKPQEHTQHTLYTKTFVPPNPIDIKLLNTHDKRHAFTKLLHQAKTTGITARELFSGKLLDKTSYNYDYRDMRNFVPTNPSALPHVVPPQERKALKYRKWDDG